MAALTLELNVVTPEKPIVSGINAEAIVLPGAMGQLTILPGHINFLTSLRLGTFGYKVNDQWEIAFLTGGFAQVVSGKITVLAETMEMSQELNLAEAELGLQDAIEKLKSIKPSSAEYAEMSAQKEFAAARVRAAKNKLH